MENPWAALRKNPPYTLPDDQPLISLFNETSDEEHRLRTELLPEPHIGRRDAPVVLLALNPGWHAGDQEAHRNPPLKAAIRFSLLHASLPVPFYPLDPRFEQAPTGIWWRAVLRSLADELRMRLPGSAASVGWDALAAQLLCLEWMPYHSQTFGATRLRLPSQDYTRSLALESIKKDAQFVLMRARELWFELVPELTTANVIELKNARRTYVSTGNMADEFDEVAGRITAEIRRVRTAAPARPTIRKRPKN